MHYADFGDLILQLPRPPGIPSSAMPEITFQQFTAHAGLLATQPIVVEVSIGPEQDTFVTLEFNSIAAGGDRASGKLHLNRVSGGAHSHDVERRNETFSESELLIRDDGDLEAEDILHELYDSLTTDQQDIYLAIMPRLPQPIEDGLTTAIITSAAPPRATTKPALYAFDYSSQTDHLNDIINSFCGAFGGHLPGNLPDCSLYPPFTYLIHTGQVSASGWYTNAVTVTLVGVNMNGKGIDHTEYHLQNGNFIRCSTPFELPEGISTIFYRSQDESGTFETTKQAVFQIDSILPDVSFVIGQPQYAQGPPVVVSSQTTLTLSGTDSGSGVSSVNYRFYLAGFYAERIYRYCRELNAVYPFWS
jgi:hypothetical protein